jgi:transposase
MYLNFSLSYTIISIGMSKVQAPSASNARFELRSERLGPLPLVNHFIARLGLHELLNKHVPTQDRRNALTHASALGVLLRSIVVEREPVYRQQETVQGFASGLFGITESEFTHLSDDRIGRALDHLFNADRAALITEVVLASVRGFDLQLQQLHNDSTSISFCGQYRNSASTSLGTGKRTAAAITYGFSKDHRPDLKQLLFILSVEGESGVPVSFRCADGNTSDSVTHIDTWNALREVAGRADFLYVADSKLCSRDNLKTIHTAGGRFVTVLPRSRLEDGEFRKWIQTNTPEWELVWDRPNPRYQDGPSDRWSVFVPELPSAEGWPVVWVHSTLLALKQEATRKRHLAAATEQLQALHQRLIKGRARLRGAAQIDQLVADILQRYDVTRYIRVKRVVRTEDRFKQASRGRPNQNTVYVKITKKRYDIEYQLDSQAIAYDQKSVGMYPLLTNDRKLTASEVLQAHKGQPRIEKRFEQVKTVHQIAPVYLKDPGRIEALFTLYFLALLVQCLIERELRLAMQRHDIKQLALYPEQRQCKKPTTELVLRLFSHTQRHTLRQSGQLLQAFEPQFTELQQQVLRLLGISSDDFCKK